MASLHSSNPLTMANFLPTDCSDTKTMAYLHSSEPLTMAKSSDTKILFGFLYLLHSFDNKTMGNPHSSDPLTMVESSELTGSVEIPLLRSPV